MIICILTWLSKFSLVFHFGLSSLLWKAWQLWKRLWFETRLWSPWGRSRRTAWWLWRLTPVPLVAAASGDWFTSRIRMWFVQRLLSRASIAVKGELDSKIWYFSYLGLLGSQLTGCTLPCYQWVAGIRGSQIDDNSYHCPGEGTSGFSFVTSVSRSLMPDVRRKTSEISVCVEGCLISGM